LCFLSLSSSFSSFFAIVRKKRSGGEGGKEGGKEGRMLFNLVRGKTKAWDEAENHAMKPSGNRSRTMSSNSSNSTSRSSNKNSYIHRKKDTKYTFARKLS